MKINNYKIHPSFYYIVVAMLIAYFFPREGKFRYQFHEGKPWRYGLLTASSDFPIYKTDEEINAERDSVLKEYEPYYRYDATIELEEIDKLRDNYNKTMSKKLSADYMHYLENSLKNLYKQGILSTQDIDKLKDEGYTKVNLIKDNISQSAYISDFFSVRAAYEFIVNNCPSSLNKQVLQSCDLDKYLTENVSFDKEMSEKVKTDMLNSVPISNGMIQAGERIVDRGEIVDNHIYNVLRSLKIIHETNSGSKQQQSVMLCGIIILVFGLIFCLWMYLFSFHRGILRNSKDALFIILCVFATCIITEICVNYGLFNIYIIPYAIIPIVIRTFFDSRTALFTALINILLCSLMAPFPQEFIMIQSISTMVVLFSLKDLYERAQLFKTAFIVFTSCIVCYMALAIYQEADINKINWMMLLYFGINFILLMFSYILVYIIEKMFGYVSSITLVELSNINNPLLKKLSETAPGTFQHSLQVSILASEAASAIGANTQLVRTGAMYHDIGKMCNPAFFTENQSSVNPHSQLNFDESAKIIINHIPDGVKMAEKYNLPSAIVDFIRTHHGRGKTKYFYNSFRNKYPDAPINEEAFTYPGPNPFTKETAILMMADTVEAASRSLKSHTEDEIKKLVRNLIDTQIADGLMKNAPLTFKDVERVKQVFIEKLKIMYHTRISYPDLKK
jgi:hypothetical protein